MTTYEKIIPIHQRAVEVLSSNLPKHIRDELLTLCDMCISIPSGQTYEEETEQISVLNKIILKCHYINYLWKQSKL